MEDNRENKIMEFEEIPAVFYIPENTISVTIEAKILDENNKVITVTKDYNPAALREAIKDGEQFIPDDAVFELTDKGKRLISDMID